MDFNYRIKRVENHYEIWIDDKFYYRVDTLGEAVRIVNGYMY